MGQGVAGVRTGAPNAGVIGGETPAASLAGRRVNQTQASAARLRLNSLRAGVQSLFSRNRSAAPSLAGAGKNGARDAQRAAALLAAPGFKEQNLLSLLHAVSSIGNHDSPEVRLYQRDFMDGFEKHIDSLDDRQIKLLDNKLRGKAAQKLRLSLDHATHNAAPDQPPAQRQAMRNECAATHAMINHLSVIVTAKISERGLPPQPSPPQPKNAPPLNKNFLNHLQARTSAHSGPLPPKARAAIEADFTRFVQEAPQKTAKESEVRISSKNLHAPLIFLKDFPRQEMIFKDSAGRTIPHDRNDFSNGDEDYQKTSDHMLKFCKGNAEQCRRLTVLLNQEAIFSLYQPVAKGEVSPPPYPGAEIELLQARENHAFTLQRRKNGDIDVCLKETLNVHSILTKNREELPIDDKKSFVSADVNFTIPAQDGAPPRFGDMTYASHLCAGESVRA